MEDPKKIWPACHARNVYSQFGEDGILEAIFAEIGTKSKFCVDIGAADGILFSNVRRLIESEGWRGILIDQDEARVRQMRQDPTLYLCQIGRERIAAEGITIDWVIECYLNGHEQDIDLLSIDIDGQDYYVFNSMMKYRPRVIVCEYNPLVEENYIPPLNGLGQAGAGAITHVGVAKGYRVVARTQTNLIMIRGDVIAEALNRPDSKLQIELPPEERPVKIAVVATVPRLGFNDVWHCTLLALQRLQLHVQLVFGVFWDQCLSRGIQEALDAGAETIVTLDYDTVFDSRQLEELLTLHADNTEFDVVVPVQVRRESDAVLFKSGADTNFRKPLTEIETGHFGLTVFDANVFRRMPKPWFQGVPNRAGEWGDGRTDPDIFFWQQLAKAGLKVASANDVHIGHLELCVSWPDVNFQVFRQSISDFRKSGRPKECDDKSLMKTVIVGDSAHVPSVEMVLENAVGGD